MANGWQLLYIIEGGVGMNMWSILTQTRMWIRARGTGADRKSDITYRLTRMYTKCVHSQAHMAVTAAVLSQETRE